MAAKKQVRIIKKVRDTDGVWRFVSLDRAGKKYVWDNRPGAYFLEWWEGRKRKREVAGQTPSEALEAQRSKGNELIGEMLTKGKAQPKEEMGTTTLITDATRMYI